MIDHAHRAVSDVASWTRLVAAGTVSSASTSHSISFGHPVNIIVVKVEAVAAIADPAGHARKAMIISTICAAAIRPVLVWSYFVCFEISARGVNGVASSLSARRRLATAGDRMLFLAPESHSTLARRGVLSLVFCSRVRLAGGTQSFSGGGLLEAVSR